ncbi:NAD(P)-dependent oxidoreductase [Actinacidiphila sp. ITFR-21]|uniref:NAD(P)-dependent oxidoreductase n=1 Tax=Actinacidiphila sp. ITFR-21 TaxID=3075199 RepID=UPI0028891B3E|nr:NAD(P)-dependent oxidoreductase [Streptomyces sp. ITFR-21]WNI16463.1 NAD(P)-dependent oxidoreductase [Streptomyces sp. ITFR-21]
MTHSTSSREAVGQAVGRAAGRGAAGERPVRIALLSRIVGGSATAMRRLRELGVEIALDLPGYDALGGDRDRWEAVLRDIDGLVVGLQPVDRRLFETAPKLRYVLRIGTGLDNVDTAAAGEFGVRVDSLAGRNAAAVAEYAFGLLLAAARRIPEADASVRAGEWTRFSGSHLGGRTLGLIGYGDIGSLMVPKAHGFGMRVLVHRRSAAAVDEPGVRTVPLDELLAASDFVSLHVPLTDATRHLLGAREFGLMRPGVVLVNTARGDVVDERALDDALASGRVAAAALDVFPREPPPPTPLLARRNVVLSPHNGGYSDLVMEQTAAAAVAALADGLFGAAPPPGVRTP